MSTSSRGNAAERRVVAHLHEQGWCCASRRHIGGAGDILAVHPSQRPRLIEVKQRQNVWEGFRRPDRKALKAEAERIGADPLLAWCKAPSKPIAWRTESGWPR